MKRSTKRTVGWGSGVGVGVTFVVLTFVLIFSVQNGSMKNLHGQDIVQLSVLDDINPAAGEEAHEEHDHGHDHHEGEIVTDNELNELGADLKDGETIEKNGQTYVKHGDHFHLDEEFVEPPPRLTDCGVYDEWIAKPLDREALDATGKKSRVLLPGSVMTMDHIPTRINVYINENNIVLDVKCG